MTIRREPTYLSTDVWKALLLLAKSHPKVEGEGITTVDEVADTMLREVIEQKFPQLLEHLKAVDKLETQLIKTLSEQ